MAKSEICVTPLKWIALFVSSLGSLASGSLMVFSVYQNALKSTYNYTQSEVEILPSMLSVGSGLAFIPGMIFDRFGPKWTNSIAFILSTGGFLLIWSSANAVNYYKKNVWLLSIYFLLIGNGCICTNFSSLNTAIVNFHNKYRGTVVGLLSTCFSSGPILFSAIYYNVIVSSDQTGEKPKDYQQFMLLLAIIFAAVNLLCILLLRIDRPETFPQEQNVESESADGDCSKESQRKIEILLKAPTENGHEQITNGVDAEDAKKSNAGDNLVVNKEREEPNRDSFCDQVKNIDFLLIVFMFALTTSSASVSTYNVTTNTKSLKIGHLDRYLTLIVPIGSLVTSLIMGNVSDRVKKTIPRTYFLMISNLLYVTAFVFLTFSIEIVGTYVTALVVHGIASGTIWCITPVYISERFGLSKFGRNWGLVMVSRSAATFAFLAIFGALYDSQIHTPGEHVCYGVSCLQTAYGIMLGISSSAFILNLIYTKRNPSSTATCSCKRTRHI